MLLASSDVIKLLNVVTSTNGALKKIKQSVDSYFKQDFAVYP